MFDLGSLRLEPGDAGRRELHPELPPIELGGQRYSVGDGPVPVRLDVQAAIDGLHLRLRLGATVRGPCYRCTEPAEVAVVVDDRQYHSAVPDLQVEEDTVSPHVHDRRLDVAGWALEAVVLALPGKILCRPGCAGLCPHCGQRLVEDDPHDCLPAAGDPRWQALDGLFQIGVRSGRARTEQRKD